MNRRPSSIASVTSIALLAVAIFGARYIMTSSDAGAEPPAKTTRATGDTLAGPPEQVEELGVVRWIRDFEDGQRISKKSGKPMLVLFTEVPGCSTVKGFGNGALSDPFIAEAIEEHFVPVAIYNNVSGEDREVLESFDEPTWNNPIVRIITHDRKPLAERFSGPYDRAGILQTMTSALTTAKTPIPTWMSLLEDEARAARGETAQATFHMYCFWSGEAKLGDIDGVVSSKTGFKGGKEVVQVTYDPSKTSYGELLEEARARGAADGVFATTPREAQVASAHFGEKVTRVDAKDSGIRGSSKDDKYQLKHHTLKHVPMTPIQASRVNSALGKRANPSTYLSPRQLELARRISAAPKAKWPSPDGAKDHAKAWWASVAIATAQMK